MASPLVVVVNANVGAVPDVSTGRVEWIIKKVGTSKGLARSILMPRQGFDTATSVGWHSHRVAVNCPDNRPVLHLPLVLSTTEPAPNSLITAPDVHQVKVLMIPINSSMVREAAASPRGGMPTQRHVELDIQVFPLPVDTLNIRVLYLGQTIVHDTLLTVPGV